MTSSATRQESPPSSAQAPSSAAFEADLVEVRRNPWILGLAASPLLLTIGCVVGGLLGHPLLFAPVAHTTILGLALSLGAWRRNWRPKPTEVKVRADPEGVTVGGRAVPRRDLRAGLVLPGLAPRVLLKRRRGLPIELQAAHTNEARALLRALGLDASQSVASFRTMSRLHAKRRYAIGIAAVNGLLFLLFVAASRFAPIGFALLLLSVLATTILAAVPTRLDVGTDGVGMRWLGRSRFIGYDAIRAVTRFERRTGRSTLAGLTLALRSGEEVSVPVNSAGWADPHEIAAIDERIREAMDVFRTGGVAADAALLRRGDRALTDWIVALRSLGAGANADMRTAPVARERLFRILEDPSIAPVDRAAAAIALGGDLDADGRARLGAVAGSIAAPKLRILLEKASSAPDPAELEATLAELAELDPSHPARRRA